VRDYVSRDLLQKSWTTPRSTSTFWKPRSTLGLQRAGHRQQALVFLGVDVVGDDQQAPALAHGLAQHLDQRGLARADRAADAHAQRGQLLGATFGCQMNEYDSAKMADVLPQPRREPTDDPEEADLILFNTCSVREKAQEKVFSDLGRVRTSRPAPGVLIGVGGCVASQEGEAIVKRAPYVDVVFGPQTLHRLPELLARASAGRRRSTSASRDREVRPPAAGARRGRQRLRLDHGRLQQVLQLLRGALHARRGVRARSTTC
jgi:hypothetical protein